LNVSNDVNVNVNSNDNDNDDFNINININIKDDAYGTIPSALTSAARGSTTKLRSRQRG